ncbi:MAG: CRISPR-associated endonuclease Cas2 [Dehalococcoidia bacterium]
MATTLLIYDIPSDRLRTKVATACLDYGLERVQYSAFQGALTRNRQEELLQRIRRIMGPHAVNVQLMPLCEKDLRSAVRWIQEEPPEGIGDKERGGGDRGQGTGDRATEGGILVRPGVELVAPRGNTR